MRDCDARVAIVDCRDACSEAGSRELRDNLHQSQSDLCEVSRGPLRPRSGMRSTASGAGGQCVRPWQRTPYERFKPIRRRAGRPGPAGREREGGAARPPSPARRHPRFPRFPRGRRGFRKIPGPCGKGWETRVDAARLGRRDAVGMKWETGLSPRFSLPFSAEPSYAVPLTSFASFLSKVMTGAPSTSCLAMRMQSGKSSELSR